MADVRGGCLKVIAWAIGAILVLIVGGFIFFSLFPPFGSTETGYLSRTEERRVTLPGAGASGTHALTVGAKAGVYGSAGRFEPLSVRVLARTDAGAPLAVHVLPADGVPVDGLALDVRNGSATWTIDCQRPTDDRPCPRDYLVIVWAPDGGGTSAVLEVFAEQRFPKYVGTPFGVGIDVTIERREEMDAAGWSVADASGALSLSPDAPVAVVAVATQDVLLSGDAGIVLAASAVRDGPAAPTGLGAPPPIRLALVGSNGAVLADLGVRPGAATAVAVPPGSGSYRLVGWWQDRADHAYEVNWRLTVAGSGTSGLTLSATDEAPPEPVGSPTTDSGVFAVGGPGSSDRIQELPIYVDIGLSAGTDSLPPMAGVLRLRLLVPDEQLAGPVAIELVPARDAELALAAPLPIVLEPGVPREIVLEAAPGCPATSCATWAVLPAGEDPRSGGLIVTEQVLVEWQASLELWPLDPYGSAVR